MSTIKVSIVSSSEEIYSGEGTMIFATGSLGEIGIAPGHAPLLTGLVPGPVRVQNGDDEKTFFCSGGFIEIQPDIVTFLSDRAERAESMGKTPGLDKKGQQRLTEKERLKKLSEDKARKMIEVLLSKKDSGGEISDGKNSLLDIKIKQLLKLSSAEEISVEDLISRIESFV